MSEEQAEALQELAQLNTQLRAANERLRAKMADQSTRGDRLERRLSGLAIENQRLSAENERLSSENDSSEKEHERIVERIETVEV